MFDMHVEHFRISPKMQSLKKIYLKIYPYLERHLCVLHWLFFKFSSLNIQWSPPIRKKGWIFSQLQNLYTLILVLMYNFFYIIIRLVANCMFPMGFAIFSFVWGWGNKEDYKFTFQLYNYDKYKRKINLILYIQQILT